MEIFYVGPLGSLQFLSVGPVGGPESTSNLGRILTLRIWCRPWTLTLAAPLKYLPVTSSGGLFWGSKMA